MKINQEYCAKIYYKSCNKQLKRIPKIETKSTNRVYKRLLKSIKKSAKNGNDFFILSDGIKNVDYNVIITRLGKLNFGVSRGFGGYMISWGYDKNE